MANGTLRVDGGGGVYGADAGGCVGAGVGGDDAVGMACGGGGGAVVGGEAGGPDGAVAGEAVAACLAEEMGPARFDRLIDPVVRFAVEGGGLRVRIPSEFHRTWLHRRLERGLLESAFERACGVPPTEVSWEVRPGSFGSSPPEVASGEASIVRGVAGEAGVAAGVPGGVESVQVEQGVGRRTAPAGVAAGRRRFALGEFIVGDSNRLAYNAALEMARREPGEVGAAALFLHGECGVGKTHLLNGVISEVRSRRPHARVRCVTGEVFANEFIAAVQKQDFETFRERYRGLELLCIDDVHFIAGKQKTMVELLHTFDALDLDGARVVLASDEHPKRIEKLSRRLVSRCVSGMVVRIERPDRSLRERLAEKMATRRGLRLSGCGLRAIADSCVGSVREIEGAVVRIEAYVRLFGEGGGDAGMAVSEDLVRRALGESARSRPAKPVQVSVIADVICDELGVEASELFGRSRHRLVVLARSMACSLAREMTTQSYPEIARALSRRNHSTVVTACQRMQRSLERGEHVNAGTQHGEVHVGELRDRLKEEVLRACAGGGER